MKRRPLVVTFIILGIFLIISSLLFLTNKDFNHLVRRALARLGVYTEEIPSVIITSGDTKPGSWNINKSAKWIGLGSAEVTFDLTSKIKDQNNHYKDIILVIDVSGSMSGNKLDRAKSDAKELVNSLLSDSNNKVALISFETIATTLSTFTNDKTLMLNKIDELNVSGSTNYNQALQRVDEIMTDYVKETNRDSIVLFLTDGYPNEEKPNQVGTYALLKSKYPYLNIHGIQYEMGSEIIEDIRKISDKQFIARQETLNNILFKAAITPLIYESFVIEDYIDNDNFDLLSIDDVSVTSGTKALTLENGIQKITWNLGTNFNTGDSAKMTIKLKLKDSLINTEGYYATNQKEKITSKLPSESQKSLESSNTPVLKTKYSVIYDTNTPAGCSLTAIPSESYAPYNTVTVKQEKLNCSGYIFKGYEIQDSDKEGVRYINADNFIMPPHDVRIRAIWSKLKITKAMDGTVHEKATLYKVLKTAAETTGGLAKEYTGLHQDSMAGVGSQKIYHWYATTNAEGTAIRNKNNVIFGGFCWEMIRTTDTGGVKLIYNGVPSSGQCNNTGTATQIGTSKFNSSSNSPAYVGYMYNTVYPYQSKDLASITSPLSSRSLSTNYWYADSISWDSGTGKYSLVNPYQVTSTTDYPTLKGKYTFYNTSQTYTSFYYVYYITTVTGSTSYSIMLSAGNDLASNNDSYTYGDSYTDNGNNTYTINNPTTFNRVDYYDNGANLKNKYLCINATSNTCSDLRYVTRSYNYYYFASFITNNYKYGSSFTYDGTKYTLSGDTVTFWEPESTNLTSLNNHHYTCFNTTGECTALSYIYSLDGTITYYINLTGGKSEADALTEMLSANNVNAINSTIKTTIDNWYQNNLTSYNSYLEDTIFCNNRHIISLGGWNPNGGSLTGYLIFKENNLTTDLSCENETDKFSVSNSKAQLTYPVGLISNSEMNLLNNTNARNTGQHYWLLSPWNWGNLYAAEHYVDLNGSLLYPSLVDSTIGGRPAISLVPGTEYVSGDGSKDNPYVVDTN